MSASPWQQVLPLGWRVPLHGYEAWTSLGGACSYRSNRSKLSPLLEELSVQLLQPKGNFGLHQVQQGPLLQSKASGMWLGVFAQKFVQPIRSNRFCQQDDCSLCPSWIWSRCLSLSPPAVGLVRRRVQLHRRSQRVQIRIRLSKVPKESRGYHWHQGISMSRVQRDEFLHGCRYSRHCQA